MDLRIKAFLPYAEDRPVMFAACALRRGYVAGTEQSASAILKASCFPRRSGGAAQRPGCFDAAKHGPRERAVRNLPRLRTGKRGEPGG